MKDEFSTMKYVTKLLNEHLQYQSREERSIMLTDRSQISVFLRGKMKCNEVASSDKTLKNLRAEYNRLNGRLQQISEPSYEYNLEKKNLERASEILKKKRGIKKQESSQKVEERRLGRISLVERAVEKNRIVAVDGQKVQKLGEEVVEIREKNRECYELIGGQREQIQIVSVRWKKLCSIAKHYELNIGDVIYGGKEGGGSGKKKGRGLQYRDQNAYYDLEYARRGRRVQIITAEIDTEKKKEGIVMNDYGKVIRTLKRQRDQLHGTLSAKIRYIILYIYIYKYIYIYIVR